MKTKRLQLRERTKILYERIIQQTSEKQLIFFGVKTIDELDAALAQSKKLFVDNRFDFRLWDIIEKSSDDVIGHCGFHHWEKRYNRAELGYFLNETARNKGYMKEAIQALINFGFENMDLNRIEAFIAPQNSPSIGVVKHLKFTKEGLLREHHKINGQFYDSFVFRLLKSEYET
ncbi:MAG: GNAT family N-acetyltransferase [Saprospiraceae bacterium]